MTITLNSPPTEDVQLNNDEIIRYSRHLIMPEVTLTGQRKLKDARVLCVGTGGLGSPVALYLAAAGVGTIGMVDYDIVEANNLQRQIIHGTSTIGQLKYCLERDVSGTVSWDMLILFEGHKLLIKVEVM